MGLPKRSYTGAGFHLLGFRPHSLGSQVQAKTPSCPKEGKHIDYKDILDLIWGIERPAPWLFLLSILGGHS